MKLSIIIPVYNEEKTIKKIITQVIAFQYKGVAKEIIVVDDGSTDNTMKEIKEIKSQEKIITFSNKENKGKGAAVQLGLQHATGEYVVTQDADMEYDPRQLSKLLEPVFDKNAKVVYGTRLKRMPHFKTEEKTFQFFLHYVGNRALSFLVNLLYGARLTDVETGYKLFRRDVIKDIQFSSRRFDFEIELTAKILRKGISIQEVVITTIPRSYKEGKKLSTIRDGFAALYAIVRYRFSE